MDNKLTFGTYAPDRNYSYLAEDMQTQEQDNQANIKNNGKPTFDGQNTSTAENIFEKINKNSDISINNTRILLINRRLKNVVLQAKTIRGDKLNKIYLMVLAISAVASIISIAIFSPFFAIALAVSVTVVAVLLAKNYYALINHDKCGIQKICTELLIKGIQNNMPTDDLSQQQNITLLNIFDNAVNSLDSNELNLIDKIRKYNRCKNNTSSNQEIEKQSLEKEIKKFFCLVFKNAEFIACLYKLNFDANDVIESISEHVDKLTLDKISRKILGKKRYTPTIADENARF